MTDLSGVNVMERIYLMRRRECENANKKQPTALSLMNALRDVDRSYASDAD